jgi:hypothetical protein
MHAGVLAADTGIGGLVNSTHVLVEQSAFVTHGMKSRTQRACTSGP